MPDTNLQKLLITFTGTAGELLQTYNKISAILLTDGTNLDVQVTAIQDGAVKDADETLKIIEEWKVAHPEA